MPKQDVIDSYFKRPTKQAIYQDCVTFLQRIPCRVLDVGAGTGIFSHEAKKLGHKVSSVDLGKEFNAFDDVKIDVCNLDTEPLPYKTGSFDIVLLAEVIEHVENPWHVVRECARVLAPGGQLYLSTPHIGSLFQRAYYLFKSHFFTHTPNPKIGAHITHIPSSFLRTAMQRAGLEVVKTNYVHAHLPFFGFALPAWHAFGYIVVVIGRKPQKGF